MTALSSPLRRVLRRRPAVPADPVDDVVALPGHAELPAVDIAPDDPLLAYVTAHPAAVGVDQLDLPSPALVALRDAGVALIVPLVAQGELIGLLNLGPRLSERPYSGEDKHLLEELATHAAPAIRVAQLVADHKAEAAEHERIKQEMRVAQLIQQQFLPHELPDLPGWQVAAYYQPAREVGGDFYDFLELPDGKVGLVAGDVSGKGVPAALVMATTHSFLRAEAPRLAEPSAVLARVNELLVDEMPPTMFVTCLYAVLDPATGELRVANAGHNLPYVASPSGCCELRARGLPLGLMPEIAYDQITATLAPGDQMLLHSDGLTEAHNPAGEMFGFPRVQTAMSPTRFGQALIDDLLGDLRRFTGTGWNQEDDITLVTLQRRGVQPSPGGPFDGLTVDEHGYRALAEFTVASEPGNERQVMQRVAEAVAPLSLPPAQLARLETAVAEATMNAIEHGNHNRPELPVEVRLLATESAVRVLITDLGGDPHLPAADTAAPDLAAKLAGLDSARGWGLFLIRSMVDAVTSTSDGDRHTLELAIEVEGQPDAHQRL